MQQVVSNVLLPDRSAIGKDVCNELDRAVGPGMVGLLGGPFDEH